MGKDVRTAGELFSVFRNLSVENLKKHSVFLILCNIGESFSKHDSA